MSHFYEDLPKGKKVEVLIANLYRNCGFEIISRSNDYKFDFKIEKNNRVKHYEVKADFIIKENFDTGNMFIEFECRNKQSGIATTQSDWYVYCFPNINEAWFIKTSQLKFLIIQNDFKVKDKAGDEGSNTKGFLVPRFRKDIKELFTIKKLC